MDRTSLCSQLFDFETEEGRWPAVGECMEKPLESRHIDFQRLASIPSPYKALNKDRKDIRLVRVAAAHPGRHEDPLFCILEQAFLDEAHIPKYETISYCWGTSSVR